ncbi:MAG: hypothetical protein NTV22_06510, partial [bacterium]|nr:hypothetical protein [bacterium]
GTYNGDQVNGVPGTTGKRNGCGIELNWYGNSAAYTGSVTVTYCLFERLGRVIYLDDDSAVNLDCYTAQFTRCTFVNNNDTSSGYWEASPFTLRGSESNRWVLFNQCVMSHSAKDTTQVNRHGMHYYPSAPPQRVYCNDDLFYTNSIGTGANNCYGATISPYAGYDTDLKTNAPVYVPFLGKSYTLQIAEGGTARGWSCTTNQNVPWIVIARTNTWVPRSTASYTLLAGTSGSLAGMLNWVNAANSQAGAIAA